MPHAHDGTREAADALDYLELVRSARRLSSYPTRKTIRLAILADFATQQLIPLLKVLAAKRGFALEIYEAGYDAVDMEVLDPGSGLYAFGPDFVALLGATQKLRSRIQKTDDRSGFAEAAAKRLTELWATVGRRSGATILQSTFVLPPERAFGSYELKAPDSLGAIVADLNGRIAAEARAAKNVLICDADFVAALHGRADWFDDRLWAMAKTYCRLDRMPLFAKAMVDTMLAAQGAIVKCVVLDLDNTLWGGVIGDDGLGGIALGDYDEGEAFVGFQRFLKELKRRGIILAVVSKNEHANAVSPFREHPSMVLKESDIAVFVANWDNKADNIRVVQKTLNIGFDTMVFLDDNPFERNIVREFLPDVIVPELPEDPALYVSALAALNLFETATYSQADRERADQYREEAQRELTKGEFSDVGAYLASLGMTARLERFSPFNLPRIAQLIQRSNQFNLLTRRYSEAVCERLMHDPACVPITLTLADKFGDYGLISVVILKLGDEAIGIDEYLMSCRVLQRGVEHLAMSAIVDFAKRHGRRFVEGRYERTAKNEMVKNFYAQFGFEKVAVRENGDSDWRLDVSTYVPATTYITPSITEL